MRIAALLLLASGTIALTGCRTYNYQIVQPTQAAATVAEQPVTANVDPLEYTFSRAGDRLAIQIHNPTEDRVTLVGQKSYVVDPTGQSHLLPGAVIAPRSHIILYLPPRPQRIEARSTGYVGVGFGAYHGGMGPYWGWGGYYDPLYYYGPTTTTYEVPTPYDWKWGTGLARLSLLFERGQESFEHRFEFNRIRA
jgi:hypothetical protein